MFNPKKTIYAKVTYADIAGLDGSAGKTGISGTLLNQLTQMDGFIHVVRCFEDDDVPHPARQRRPGARHGNAMDSEFMLNDLIAVERKLERLVEETQEGRRAREGRHRARAWRSSSASTPRSGRRNPLRDLAIDRGRREDACPALVSSAASRC